MAYTSYVQLNISVMGAGQPGVAMNDTINESNASAPGTFLAQYAFATGDNTITFPVGATQVIVNNISGTLKLCSGAGIAGYPLGTALSAKIPLSGTTVVFNASAGAKADLWYV